jgi:hypothetical protein
LIDALNGFAGYRESKMVKLEVGAMKKVKVLTILLTIFSIGCFASARASKPRLEPDGFRDIKWETEISTLKDMKKVEQDRSSNSDLVWYTREGDTLAIGKAKLEDIFYSFWMGNFESVWIDFKGEENFEALKKELLGQFGIVLESKGSMKKMGKEAGREPSATDHAGELYAWWGKNTEMWLSYSKDRHKGTLTINSTVGSEKRRAYEKQKEKEERLKEKGF